MTQMTFDTGTVTESPQAMTRIFDIPLARPVGAHELLRQIRSSSPMVRVVFS